MRTVRTSTKLIRLGAVVPAGLAGSFIAVIGLGFLPDLGLVAAFAGTLVLSLVLACGAWEAPAVRVFGFARSLRPGERGALGPALALLKVLELEPGRVLMRLADTGELPARWIGRRTVIVDPTLVQGLYENRLTREDAAAAIGHAVASQRIGPSRLDLAARLWAFPWTLLHAVVRQIARAFSWVPAAGFAWQMRFMIGVIVVVQGFQPGGDPALGIATGALIAISYIAPAADRHWRRVVERAADREVALAGLAGSMVHYAQWQDGADSLERVHRISEAAAERQRRKKAVQDLAASDTESGALVLTHPTARR